MHAVLKKIIMFLKGCHAQVQKQKYVLKLFQQ